MTTDQAAQQPTAPAGYLLPHELHIRRTFYGVPVFWAGEDGDTALALTGDWRLGCAAAHALGRADLGGPVRSQVSGDQAMVRWTRFEPVEELDEDWAAVPVPVGTEGAVQVVWVNELCDYKPNYDFGAAYAAAQARRAAL